MVANPTKLSKELANVSSVAEGLILADVRATVRYQEVRVAGTPSSYPNFLVFPKNWETGDRKVFTLSG